MALQPNALTSYAAAKAALRLPDDTRQTDVERAINAASDSIAAFCRRGFRAQARTETQRSPGPLLFLSCPPLLSVTSWSLNGEAQDETALPAIEDAECGLVDVGGPSGGAWDLGGYAPRAARHVVGYVGGFKLPGQLDAPEGAPDLPALVEQVAINTAVTIFRGTGGDGRVASETLGDYSVTYGGVNTAIGRGAGGWISDLDAVTLAPFVLPVIE